MSFKSFCSMYDSYMIVNFFLPIPSTSISLSILFSITFKVSSPKWLTIFFAVTGPIPYIIPALKYFSIASTFVGNISSKSSILNCFPNCL